MPPFKDLDPQASEASRRLATEMRSLFHGLGEHVSLTRYAATVHLDKSVVSRYFSGMRVPPWAFVNRLLVDSALHRDGGAPTMDVVEHLRSLHRAALEAGGSPSHAVQLLQEQLAESELDARGAATSARILERALLDAQRRIAELELRERELEAAPRELRAELVRYQEWHYAFECERGRLVAEIEDLRKQLDAANRRRLEAEEQCRALERQLETAEHHAAAEAAAEQVRTEEALRAQLEVEQARAGEMTLTIERLRHQLSLATTSAIRNDVPMPLPPVMPRPDGREGEQRTVQIPKLYPRPGNEHVPLFGGVADGADPDDRLSLSTESLAPLSPDNASFWPIIAEPFRGGTSTVDSASDEHLGDWRGVAGTCEPGVDVHLTIIDGPGIGATYSLVGERLAIGRSAECEVVLDDTTVSRRHAEIYRSPTCWMIRDTYSSNGVFVGDFKIDSPVPLPLDTPIRIGQVELRLDRS